MSTAREVAGHCPECGHLPDAAAGGGICIGCPCPEWHGAPQEDGPTYCAQCWMNGKQFALVNGDCPNYRCPPYVHGYKERPATVVPS